MSEARIIKVLCCDKRCPYWNLHFGPRGQMLYFCRVKLNKMEQPIVKTFPRDCPLTLAEDEETAQQGRKGER